MRRLSCLLLLAACKDPAPVAVAEAEAPDASAAPVASAAPIVDAAVPKPDMTLETKRLLERWDSAWNAHDANAVALNYMPQVKWYGRTLTREACKTEIAALVAKAPGQTQSSAVDTVTEGPDGVRVKFTKTVTNAEKTKPHTSYWHLVKSQSGGLRIDEEADKE